jgi:hypothetical protein
MKGYLLVGLFGCIFLSSCGGGTKTVTLTPASPKPAVTHLAVSAPANASSGVAFNFTVTALDERSTEAAEVGELALRMFGRSPWFMASLARTLPNWESAQTQRRCHAFLP